MYLFNKIIVNPQLPKRIDKLSIIANNLWWSWNTEFLRLFKMIDIDLWESVGKNPIKFLKLVPQEKLEEYSKNSEFLKEYDKNVSNFEAYMNSKSTVFSKKFPDNKNDLKLCMQLLKKFHNLNLKVNHEFNIYKQIEFYEDLWNGKESAYKDYKVTKQNVFSLKEFINSNIEKKCLTHIDAVPDNFLFSNNEIKLIDWEYAGMQDPHVDIAMFCIYSLYDKEQIDKLIDIYFDNKCQYKIRLKIYSYIATCGLLWSNWCEFKSHFGIDFGEYSLKQYRYAKEYYRIVKKELEKGM